MNPDLLLHNLAVWCVQVVALIAVAAVFPALARLRTPSARLGYWQIAVVACLALPFLRPWQQQTLVIPNSAVSAGVKLPIVHRANAAFTLPDLPTAVIYLLIAGVVIRFGLIALGLSRLSRYRRRATPLTPASTWAVEADLLVSGEIGSPVTFGFLRPVVLLPANFGRLEESSRDAVLCHEILHIRRKDWLFTLAEEAIRAVFWFHPAVWWALGEIHLAREQTVDRDVIETLKSRDQYVDALLTLAGASAVPDLAPAPSFFRKRQLKQRLVSILKEARMSQKRTLSTLAAGISLLAASCWLITGALPLKGSPQAVSDDAGVTVELNGAQILHRSGLSYPPSAMASHIQGNVVAQVKTDAAGNVVDASILSGPDELRKPVLQSLLNWHFARGSGSQQIVINFAAPATAVTSAVAPVAPVPDVKFGIAGGMVGGVGRIAPPPPPPPPPPAADVRFTLSAIEVSGLSDQAKQEVLDKLPVHVGDTIAVTDMQKVTEAARAVDEHLSVGLTRSSSGSATLTIHTPDAPLSIPGMPRAAKPGQLRIGGAIEAANLVSQPKPVYPPLAKAARVQGTVRFDATIGKDGTVQNLALLSGPPLLVQAAMEAVQQWVYKPTLLNGNPVEVLTTVDVNFTLAQ